MTTDGPPREIHHRTPFNSPLVESGFNKFVSSGTEDIRALKADPDKIVRVRQDVKGAENVHSVLVRHKHVLNTLKNKYGFDIPDVDIVIGPGEEDDLGPREYIVTDRIHGQTLSDKQFAPSEIPTAREKLDKFFSSNVQYYWDVSKEGGDYSSDLAGLRQFVWGRKKGDTEDKIYLVDLGIATKHHNLDSESNHLLLESLYIPPGGRAMLFLYEDIAVLEDKLGLRLDGARQKLGQFMDDLLARGPLEEKDRDDAIQLRWLAEFGIEYK